MSECTLYIIGNGFDLKHGIKRGYDKFCGWIERYNPILFRKINLTYKITGPQWWHQFEQNLAEIPFNAIISRSYEDAHIIEVFEAESSNLVGIVNDIVQEIGYDISHLMLDLHCAFWDFVHNIDVRTIKPLVVFPDTDSVFLNFNYTDTLESVYRIDAEKIFHIHGYVKNSESDLVFGHGKSYDELYARLSKEAKETNHSMVEDEFEENEVIADASNQLLSARKSTEDILRKNEDFFCNLSSVTNVCSMGFSFSDVDLPYVDSIAQNVNSNAVWKFGWHIHKDKERMASFAKRHGLNNVEYFEF